jgi:hypothetical protein
LTSAELAAPSGSSLVGYLPAGTGAVATTVQGKLRESVSVKDFGAVCNGIADDTAAIIAAFATGAKEVLIEGICLITGTITVPAFRKLRFTGGLGNLPGANMSPSYLKKAASMTTDALHLTEGAWVDGGGIEGVSGNTGGGVRIIGNGAKISNFTVSSTGGVGVRVGTDVTYANTNVFQLDNVKSMYNTSHGIYVHDGVSGVVGTATADANAGTMTKVISDLNGGDGIRIGNAYWTVIVNGITHGNTGFGLYLSGNVNGSNLYPECRWANIIGGDFNEGNSAGEVFDASYFSVFVNADPSALPTTAANGLQGSARRSTIGGTNTLEGLTINNRALNVNTGVTFPETQVASPAATTLDDYREATFTGTAVGFTPEFTTELFTAVKAGRSVVLEIPLISGTSNSDALQVTGVPVQFRPGTTRIFLCSVKSASGSFVIGSGNISSAGIIRIFFGLNLGNFATTGTKAVDKICISYVL